MRVYKQFILLIVLICSFPYLANAQNGGFAGATTRIGFGPRGLGMGNALTAVTNQGTYGYYNPALSAIPISGPQIDLTVASLDFDRELQTISAAVALPPKAGISFYLLRAGVQDIDGRTLSGFHTDFFNTNEFQLATAFGIRFNNNFYGGFGLKINVADLADDLSTETNFGLDFGLLAKITPKINVAFTVQDLISEYTFNSQSLFNSNQSQNVTNAFPTRIKFASAFQEDKWVLTSEFEVRVQRSEIVEREVILFDGTPDIVENVSEINTSSTLLRFGGAYDIHERLTLRSGYRFTDLTDPSSRSFSAGFSVHLPFDKFSPSIDYAFVSEPFQISDIHIFALRLNL